MRPPRGPASRCRPSALEEAAAWFDGVTGADLAAGYARPGDGGLVVNRQALRHPDLYPDFAEVPEMTALALAARLAAGRRSDDDAAVQGGLAILAARPPRRVGSLRRKEIEASYLHGLAGALSLRAAGDPEALAAWSSALRAALLRGGPTGQRADGDAAGSWDPADTWGVVGGRVYATAANALALALVEGR